MQTVRKSYYFSKAQALAQPQLDSGKFSIDLGYQRSQHGPVFLEFGKLGESERMLKNAIELL